MPPDSSFSVLRLDFAPLEAARPAAETLDDFLADRRPHAGVPAAQRVEAEQTLWALGHDEPQAYDLVDWDSAKPSLKLRKSWPLRSASGHDLSPVPGREAFIVTTNTNV